MDLEYLLETEAGMEVPADQLEEIEELELEEYLDNLGYIHIDQNQDDRVVDWPTIMKGIALFRKEYVLCYPVFKKYPSIFNALIPLKILDDPPKDALTEEELDFFAQLSSIEGKFDLHLLSKEDIKTNRILCRVLNYRLSILGLLTVARRSGYTVQVDRALGKLGRWAQITTYKGQLELIGNIHALALHFAQAGEFPNSKYHQICYVKDKDGRLKGGRNKVRFRTRFIFLEAESVNAFEERGKNKRKIEPVIKDGLNQLMCRIVQIKLWLLGVYPGKLDSDIGPMSVQAINDLIAFLRDLIERTTGKTLGKDDAITIKDILVRLNNEHWAINTTFLFKLVFPVLIDKLQVGGNGGEAKMSSEEEMEMQNATVAGELGELAQSMGKAKQKEFYNALDDVITKKEEELSVKGRKKKKRKVKTRGGRDFFKSVKRFFGNLLRSIAKGIQFIIDSIKKLFNWIKNGIKVLIREIKKVFKLLRKGVQFIFGKKKIVTKDKTTQTVITTHYDADFDSVTRMNQAKPELIKIHLAKNRDILLALEECSNFLGMALFIVVHITPPVGWLKLGIKLVRYLAGTRFKYQRFSFPG